MATFQPYRELQTVGCPSAVTSGRRDARPGESSVMPAAVLHGSGCISSMHDTGGRGQSMLEGSTSVALWSENCKAKYGCLRTGCSRGGA